MENTISVCWCQNRLTYVMVLVQIHTLLHFEQFIFEELNSLNSSKAIYIFCLIVLQTLISVIISTWLAFKIYWERVERIFFMDNFDLVLLNHVKQTEVLSILRSFVHINVLKVLWRKHFLKTIYHLRIPINFVVSCVLFLQKQPPELFCKKRCSEKFRKIHEKTPVAGSLF